MEMFLMKHKCNMTIHSEKQHYPVLPLASQEA